MSLRLLRGLIENDSARDRADTPRFVAEGATVFAARGNHTGTVTLPKHPNLSTGGPLLWPAGNPNALYHCDSND